MTIRVDGCATLADVLNVRASAMPDAHAYTFLKDGESEQARLTYSALDPRINYGRRSR